MKNLILILLFTFFATTAGAQTANIDTTLKFEKFITAFEKHWVVLKKPDAAPYYTFGYVYIQANRGFMLKVAGQFEINRHNKYILRKGVPTKYIFNAQDADQSASVRLLRHQDTTGFMNVWHIIPVKASAISSKHFKELKIKAEPQWVKPYYAYTDSLEHNYRWACYHMEEFDFETGIAYFEKVYKVSPHYQGVPVPMDHAAYINHQGIELKLSAVYNSSHQYNKAVDVLQKAILNDPSRIQFYQELLFTYYYQEDWKMVISVAKRGLAQITVEKSDPKRDLAAWIAKSYEEQKNDEQGKYWRQKSLEYSLCPGCVY